MTPRKYKGHKMKKLSLLLALILALAAVFAPFASRAEQNAAEWYDLNSDSEISSDDAIYLLRHVMFPRDYPVGYEPDLDRNGRVDSDDAVYLLRYTLFPGGYPLCAHEESDRITDKEPDAQGDGEWHTECTVCHARLHSGVIPRIDENGTFTSKNDVALYLHTYGKLPSNYITKAEAQALGWKSGDLWKYAPGKSIGGDEFYNREGLLPKKSGRKWYECDIGYAGGNRNSTRIVWSTDGLIYYTDDHYESFTQLY